MNDKLTLSTQLVNQILGKSENNTDFKELFDPETNARVAYEFYKRSGNTTRPWGGYKGMSDTKGADQYLADAQKSVKAAGLGDPNPRVARGVPVAGSTPPRRRIARVGGSPRPPWRRTWRPCPRPPAVQTVTGRACWRSTPKSR